jgi:hypothetical protein
MGLKSEEVMVNLLQLLALTNDLMKSLSIRIYQTKNRNRFYNFADGKESYFEKKPYLPSNPGEDQIIDIGCYYFLRNITVLKNWIFAKTNFIATVST